MPMGASGFSLWAPQATQPCLPSPAEPRGIAVSAENRPEFGDSPYLLTIQASLNSVE